jgi:hypothetical protein
MATKQQVIDLSLQHPTWTARDIADHLDCMVEYVFACKRRYGLKFGKGNYRDRDPNSAITIGRVAKRYGLTVKDIQHIAEARAQA